MTFWFLTDLARLSIEHRAVADLQAKATWLAACDWSLTPALRLDATIRVANQNFKITLVYPDHFPFSLPIARPTLAGEHWSHHQYRDGTLCLEWGPDTWRTDLTAADMLESGYRLLSVEHPETEERAPAVPSRHLLTIGQRLRGEHWRFCTTHSLRTFWQGLPIGSHGQVAFSLQFHRHCSVVVVTKVLQEGQVWQDPEVPAGVDPCGLTGVFCKVAAEARLRT